MSDEQGLVDKVPAELWSAYEKRAAEYAAMHGNGSRALKSGILKLTLEAWLSGHGSKPISLAPAVETKLVEREMVARSCATARDHVSDKQAVMELADDIQTLMLWAYREGRKP